MTDIKIESSGNVATASKEVSVGGKTYHLVEGTERPNRLLIESYGFIQDLQILGESDLSLEERKQVKSKGGLFCSGKIGITESPTANGRLYQKPIVQRECTKITEKAKNFGFTLSEVDHPGDGKSRLEKVGALIHELRVESDDSIWGKFHIVETRLGKDIKAIVEAGGAIGVSSRGIGTTTTTEEGYDLVGEDFRLATFDLVADPAASGAYPKFYTEDEDGKASPVQVESISADDLAHEFPKTVLEIREEAYAEALDTVEAIQNAPISDSVKESVLRGERERLKEEAKSEAMTEARAALRDEFAIMTVALIQEHSEKISKQALESRASDPMEASAQDRLRQVRSLLGGGNGEVEVAESRDTVIADLRAKLTESDERVSKVQTRLDERETLMIRMGKQSFVDAALQLREDSDEIREKIGDLDQYETADALKESLESFIEEAEERTSELEEATQSGAGRERVKQQNRIKSLESSLQSERDKAKRRRSAVGTEVADMVEGLNERFETMMERQKGLEKELKRERRARKVALTESESKDKEIKKAKRRAGRKELENFAIRRGRGHKRIDECVGLIKSGEITSSNEVNRWLSRHEESTSLDERVTQSLRKGSSHRSSASESGRRSPNQVQEDFSGAEFYNEQADLLGLNADDVCGTSAFA